MSLCRAGRHEALPLEIQLLKNLLSLHIDAKVRIATVLQFACLQYLAGRQTLGSAIWSMLGLVVHAAKRLRRRVIKLLLMGKVSQSLSNALRSNSRLSRERTFLKEIRSCSHFQFIRAWFSPEYRSDTLRLVPLSQCRAARAAFWVKQLRIRSKEVSGGPHCASLFRRLSKSFPGSVSPSVAHTWIDVCECIRRRGDLQASGESLLLHLESCS